MIDKGIIAIICLLLLPMIGWGAERGDTAGECR